MSKSSQSLTFSHVHSHKFSAAIHIDLSRTEEVEGTKFKRWVYEPDCKPDAFHLQYWIDTLPKDKQVYQGR